MIVYFSVCNFYLKALSQYHAPQPIVLLDGKVVLDLNQAAEGRGVKVGMSRSEAKAIVPEAQFQKWMVDPYREAQRKWLDVCCRHTDVVEPQLQHDAFLDFSGHPDPVDVLHRLEADLANELGMDVRYGVADVKWIARLAFEVGDPGLSAFCDPLAFLASLPVSMLRPVPPEHRQRLDFLGYRHIGSAMRIPLSTLRAQFGDGALAIYRAVRGGMSEPVQPVYPQRSASARCRFEPAADQREVLEDGLRQLAEQLARRLCQSDLQGAALTLIMEGETEIYTLDRQFSKPMQGVHSVLFGLKRLFDSAPVEVPIERMAAHMQHLVPATRKQGSLYVARPSQPKDAVQSALDSLKKTFGENSVMLAADQPEPRSKKVMRAWKEGMGWT